jgi:hypothetical protein
VCSTLHTTRGEPWHGALANCDRLIGEEAHSVRSNPPSRCHFRICLHRVVCSLALSNGLVLLWTRAAACRLGGALRPMAWQAKCPPVHTIEAISSFNPSLCAGFELCAVFAPPAIQIRPILPKLYHSLATILLDSPSLY